MWFYPDLSIFYRTYRAVGDFISGIFGLYYIVYSTSRVITPYSLGIPFLEHRPKNRLGPVVEALAGPASKREDLFIFQQSKDTTVKHLAIIEYVHFLMLTQDFSI